MKTTRGVRAERECRTARGGREGHREGDREHDGRLLDFAMHVVFCSIILFLVLLFWRSLS